MARNRESNRSAHGSEYLARAFENLEGRSMMAVDLHLVPQFAPPAASNTLCEPPAVIAPALTNRSTTAVAPQSPSLGGSTTITVPGIPTGVTGTAGDGKVLLSWTAPTSTGGADRVGYTVQYSADSGTTWTTVNARFAGTRAVICNLTNGTPYIFHVAAINRAGTGAYSDPSAAVTPAAPVITVPGAPTGVTATAGDGKVLLTWTAPASKGGADRVGYIIQYSTDSGTNWTTVNVRFDQTRAIIPFLTNGTAYVFRVAAVNVAGTGVYSDPSTAVTPAAGLQLPLPPRR